MKTLEFSHLPPTPSANVWVGRPRYRYKAARRVWLRVLGQAYLVLRPRPRWPRPPDGRVRVVVQRSAPSPRWLDHDNYLGGLKPLLDALTALELIRDDNPRAIELVATQEVATDGARTCVRLELLEEADRADPAADGL